MTSRPWYDSAFARDYLLRYPHRSDELALAEAPFIRAALQLPPGAYILDLCCGAGRHSRALAAAGYTVTGVDRSADLLRAARNSKFKIIGRARAHAQNSKLKYLRADMRTLPFPAKSFDGCVNLFTSFGYFPRDASNARVLREAARVLKSGAPLLLDFFNLRATLRGLQPVSERRVGERAILERRWFDAKTRRLNKIAQIEGDRQIVRESVRAYSPSELAALLKQAGFTVEKRFGDLHGAVFDAQTSPRCVLLARKR